jgi:hypothetical protein
MKHCISRGKKDKARNTHIPKIRLMLVTPLGSIWLANPGCLPTHDRGFHKRGVRQGRNEARLSVQRWPDGMLEIS